jgi:hypothetical protein
MPIRKQIAGYRHTHRVQHSAPHSLPISVFARRLGVELTTISLIVSSRSFIGILAIFLQYQTSAAENLACCWHTDIQPGCRVGGHSPFPGNAWRLDLSNRQIPVDPAMQAYLGPGTLSAARLALSFTEMGWSFAFIGSTPDGLIFLAGPLHFAAVVSGHGHVAAYLAHAAGRR